MRRNIFLMQPKRDYERIGLKKLKIIAAALLIIQLFGLLVFGGLHSFNIVVRCRKCDELCLEKNAHLIHDIPYILTDDTPYFCDDCYDLYIK